MQLAGSVTAVFNCQGPLNAPVFVGSGMVSRTFSHFYVETSASAASEALAKSREAGALAAFDRVPFSYVSANFTFDTDNCVSWPEEQFSADLLKLVILVKVSCYSMLIVDSIYNRLLIYMELGQAL